jgi:hypothetical protein
MNMGIYQTVLETENISSTLGKQRYMAKTDVG